MAQMKLWKQNQEEIQITVEVNDIDHILSPPERDPFSSNITEYMGQSAIQRCKAMIREERGWDKRKYRFTFLMPSDQIGRRSIEEIKTAISRYCATLRKDNEIQLQVIMHRGFRQLPFALSLLLVFVISGIVIGSDAVVEMSPLLATAISEGLYIIGWVALWGPTDTLLFEPMELRTENKLLAMMEKVEIEVRPSNAP
jgi:hypothetical protein